MGGEGCAGLIVDELLCVTVGSAQMKSWPFTSLMASTALPTQPSTISMAWMAAFCNTGMTYHIRVCKVDDDHIVSSGI